MLERTRGFFIMPPKSGTAVVHLRANFACGFELWTAAVESENEQREMSCTKSVLRRGPQVLVVGGGGGTLAGVN